MAEKVIANRASNPVAVNVNPDMCVVNGAVVACEIVRDLSHAVEFSPNVNARGVPVITLASVIQGVEGNKGNGVSSGVALDAGYIRFTSGAFSVKTNKYQTVRHLSRCQMNCHSSGTENDTHGIVYIQKDPPLNPADPRLPCNQPPATSEHLEYLKGLKEQFAVIDPDQADSIVQFDALNQMLDESIRSMDPGAGANEFYQGAAGAGRAILGFAKDLFLAPGQLLYEGSKALSLGGIVHGNIDSAIFAENVRLGNVCAESVMEDLKKIKDSILAPISEPWERGQHVEAVTRGLLEVAAIVLPFVEAQKAAALERAATAERAAGATAAAGAREAGAAGAAAEAGAAREAGAAAKAEVAEGAGVADDAAKGADDVAKGGDEAAKAGPDEGVKVELPKVMDEVEVPCFNTTLPPGKHPEFDRQLGDQQKGLNDMTVQEYMDGRNAFEAAGRGSGSVAQAARDAFAADIQAQYQAQFMAQQMSVAEAAAAAAVQTQRDMATLAALHSPDQKAGGANIISGFGDKVVNSSIGGGWSSRVGALDKAASAVPEGARATTKMNAKLKRCK